MIYAIGILVVVIGVLGYLLLRSKEKLGGFKVTIEKDNVEKQIIEENRKAVWANQDTINKLDDAGIKQLRKEFTRRK